MENMDKYPMLSGIDKDRVSKVGGKAAILEEILKRWPKAHIPPFKVFDDSEAHMGMLEDEKRIFRASSELDIFGGCGLHESFNSVTYNNADMVKREILERSKMMVIEQFAESVGKKYKKPTIISQEERRPNYWGVMMQHPNDHNVFMVVYSDSPSLECKDAFYLKRGLNINFNDGRKNYTALCDKNDITGNLRKKMIKKLLKWLS